MPNLTEAIQVIPKNTNDEPEDIFAASLSLIFNDVQTQHGDPGSTIVYKSFRFGDLALTTADPQDENERQLFGHYLWNAGIKMADLISGEHESEWSVTGKKVLELGAGVGLVGIVATLAGAKEVVLSDYPAPEGIATLRRNAKKNIPIKLDSVYRIEEHEWGDDLSAFATDYAHHFDRILAADCFWMPSQHANLIKSMMHFLTMDGRGRIFAIAGFHTGRAKLASFFEALDFYKLEVEDIYEEDADGSRREWLKERDSGREDPAERKRWLVIAVLKRKVS